MRAAVYDEFGGADVIEVREGHRVLVHAAGGGVGQFAVQVAKARGAYVVGTARSDKHDHLRAIGVDEVIDYTRGPVSEQLSAKVDAVVDLVGGEALEDAPQQVHDPARIASVVDADTVLRLGGRYVFVRPEASHLDELAALAESGRLRVDLAATYPLDQLADAHRTSEEGRTRGKIAVTI